MGPQRSIFRSVVLFLQLPNFRDQLADLGCGEASLQGSVRALLLHFSIRTRNNEIPNLLIRDVLRLSRYQAGRFDRWFAFAVSAVALGTFFPVQTLTVTSSERRRDGVA